MRMLSARVHTIIGLIVGVALLAAPWLFGFADLGGAAVIVPLVVGAVIIISELTTTSVVSPLKLVPMSVHIVMDVMVGFFLALSPWFFGFNDSEPNAWVPHLAVGILVMGYALMTRVDDETNTAA